MPTLNQLINDVRYLCGGPDSTEVPNEMIRDALKGRTLEWINRRRPAKAFTYFETVANQQDYDAKPANAYRVTNVWWLSADFEHFSPDMRYLPESHDLNYQLAGFSVIDNPSLVEQFYKFVTAYQNNFAGEGYETGEGKIRLAPAPSTTGDDVYFEYTYPRWSSIEDVAAEFIEGCRHQAASVVLDYMFVKRGMVRSGRTFTGGGGVNERDLANDMRDKAAGMVPVASAVFSVG